LGNCLHTCVVKRIKIQGLIERSGVEIPNKELAGMPRYTLEDLEKELSEAGGNPVEVEINTPGGNVDVGIAMFRVMRNYPGVLDTLGHEISSIGSVLQLGATGKRRVVKDAVGMIHQAWIDPLALEGIQLNADTLQELQTEAENSNNKIVSIYTEVLGPTKEVELREVMKEETILGAERLVELGFATEIAPGKKKELKARALHYSNQFLNLIHSETMDIKVIQEKIDKMQSAFEAFMNFQTKATFKAENLPLDNGTEIFVQTDESGTLAGKVAYEVANGQPTETPVQSGTYKLQNGKEIIVGEAGMITDEKQAPAAPATAAAPDEVENLKAQLAAALAENTALKAATTVAQTDAEAKLKALEDESKKKESEMSALVQNLRTEFDSFKKELAGPAPDATQGRFQAARKTDQPISRAELLQQNILNKYN
jgi:ATP-dependent protease ClpP protease subunit